jgi:5-methylcytosine-specific restriction endonuclease McrA
MKHRTNNLWKNKGKYCCPECYRDHRWGSDRPRIRRSRAARRSASEHALARSLRKRCKVFGVTFDPACTREAVLRRDNLRCQKCRIVCNKEYVLHPHTFTPDLRNAEHDHIVPLSVEGSPGNVFENSQCLCRGCNMAKGDTAEGQLRLCLEEEAWGKGVRVRSQRNSRSCAGNPGCRPINQDEPQPPTDGVVMPSHLGEVAAAKWAELLPLLQAVKVMTRADIEARGSLLRHARMVACRREPNSRKRATPTRS